MTAWAPRSIRCATRPAARPSGLDRQHPIRRTMTVKEGADVDDDLLAHVDTALNRRRTHVRQDYHLAFRGQLNEFRVNRRLVFEDVQPGTGQLAVFQHLDERIL